MFKKIFALFILSLSLALPVFASGNPVDESDQYSSHVYFFHSSSCPHCKEEMKFLIEISKEEKYQDVQFLEFEITQNQDNASLMKLVGETLDLDTSGVPMTIIGDQVIVGYLSEETTGKQIRQAIDDILDYDPDIVGAIIRASNGETENIDNIAPDDTVEQNYNQTIPETITLPVFGDVQTANLSLPLISIVLGAVDGFNPCAMWTLVFLISLLIGMKDKKRMWILGSAFLIASATVYYIFMAAWLNILIFIGYLIVVRIIIGIVAIGGGSYSIHDFYSNKNAECKVGDIDKKQKIMDRMREVVRRPSFILAFIGIIALAFAVNLVELICSAGIPAVFTQVLTMTGISTLGYYGYMFLYILFYMLDDMIIFIIAMKTLEITGATTKYTRMSRLIGGIIMLIIGILMILKPEYLTFG
jgi:thiol-disulfide isomerase/thioredoxin